MLAVCFFAAVYSAKGATNCCDSSTYDKSYDYFPNKAIVDHSAGFSVEYFKNYKFVKIPQRNEQYVLTQSGTTAPDKGQFAKDNTTFITIPIERAAVLSNAYFPYFELIGERRSMVVTTKFDYLNDACLQKMALQDGLLDGVTNRNLTKSNPFTTNKVDVIFRWSGSRDNDLTSAGPPVVRVDTGAAKTAAGFMEWIEYVSLFFNKELEASKLVAEMKARYDCIVASQTSATKVKVLYASFSYRSGIVKCSFSDSTWHKLMITQMGGEVIGSYPGYSSSKACNMTAFRMHAETADVWLYKSNNFQKGRYGSTWSVMWNISSEIADIPAYKNGRTFDPNGNHFRDFWSSRVVQLDVELEDFLVILHPSSGYTHKRGYWLDVKKETDPGRPNPDSCTCKYGTMQLKADACPGKPKTAPTVSSKPNSEYGCNGELADSVCNAHCPGATKTKASGSPGATTTKAQNQDASGSPEPKPLISLASLLLIVLARFE